ncbi:unnamed protein product [Lupinus luteus]|uniref:Uncharacterized protein n=1 Tax=Lupinus luteus TaxID=3873 RepID=A0AAV1WBT9_LUPLU
MDIETSTRENYASQPMHLQENYSKQPSAKDEVLLESPSLQGSVQDFQHIDQFHHANDSSPNQVFGVQTQNFDPFDGYECKAFVENNGSSSQAHVIDNFQYEGYGLSPHKKSQMDMMASNQSYLPLNPLETKPSNFVAPDEDSCISPALYYNRVCLNRSNKTSLTTRRSCKNRKKTNIVKGQWTENEDRQKTLYTEKAKEVWTDEEDKILIQAHAEIGNKWAEIAKRLPGRTENSIKNHWNATKRRQYSKRKCCSKYPRGTILQDYIKSLNLDKNTPKDYTTQPSSNTMRKKASTMKSAAAAIATQPHSTSHVSSNDRLVPNYEFNEDPDFCFHGNIFQEGCSIDSFLDDMPCAATTYVKDFDAKVLCASNNKKGKQVVNVDEHNHYETEMAQEMEGNEVKKELDLVEMVAQVNQCTND